MFDWLLGMFLPSAPSENSVVGLVLFLAQIAVLITQLVLVGRARRYRLEAERHALRAEEHARVLEVRKSG